MKSDFIPAAATFGVEGLSWFVGIPPLPAPVNSLEETDPTGAALHWEEVREGPPALPVAPVRLMGGKNFSMKGDRSFRLALRPAEQLVESKIKSRLRNHVAVTPRSLNRINTLLPLMC